MPIHKNNNHLEPVDVEIIEDGLGGVNSPKTDDEVYLPKIVDCGIDHSLLVNAYQQLAREFNDIVKISSDDADKVDHIEFSIRLNPEIVVKVYPKR